MRSVLFTIIVLVCLVSASFAGAAINHIYLSNENGQIVLTWTTGQEDNVDGFFIERAMVGSDQFISIIANKIPATGSGSTYQFKDLSAQKVEATAYHYRLVTVNKDQSRDITLFPGIISPGAPISAVRRTWGSIKALFR